MAIEKTGTQMNHPNDVMLGKGSRCFCCGKDDRMSKDCPLPYTEALAFAPKKGKPSAQKNPKKVYFLGDEEQEPTDEVEEQNSHPVTSSIDNAEEQSNELLNGTETEHTARLSNWFDNEEDAFTADC